MVNMRRKLRRTTLHRLRRTCAQRYHVRSGVVITIQYCVAGLILDVPTTTLHNASVMGTVAA